MRPFSSIVLDGPDRAPSRAMLYPVGFKEADFKKAVIGIASTDAITVKRTKSVSLEELWDYEAKHPVVFAAPRALAEARLIANLAGTKRNRRQSAHRNSTSPVRHRNAVAA